MIQNDSYTKKVLTISEITLQIKRTLEENYIDVAVVGEISNFKSYPSGHLYFTLKDQNASLNAVMWRSRVSYLKFTPQDGMKVIARGTITVYQPQGKYQIDIAYLQPLGIGELQIAFEKLKQKLASEGLFDSKYKKSLPAYPKRIGIITSESGAALQDILNIISRRYPIVEIILYPVKVQGIGAAQEIAQAIEEFNVAMMKGMDEFTVDVLIVGRGGGSIEDLWAFNEEIVARAIFASKIPIVSAVGHEIDYTIVDFVADLRAPTPSAAAELVVPNRLDLIEKIRNLYYNIKSNVQKNYTDKRTNILNIISSYAFHLPKEKIKQYYQSIDELDKLIKMRIFYKFEIIKQKLIQLTHRIQSLDSNLVLKRGYSIVFKNSHIIDSVTLIGTNERIKIKFKDGHINATTEE